MRPPDESLRRNRDFNLLWGGQVVSQLGSRVSMIAMPLLALAMTGSPAKAGLVGFAASFPILALALPAGALVDRLDRKRVMIAADCCRCAAFLSLVAGLAAGAATFGQLVAVAAVEGAGFVCFDVAERAALPSVVSERQLPDALLRNQGREFGALLVGQPLGGALFAIGRVAPFLFDAVSYAVSVISLLRIRGRFQPERARAVRPPIRAEVRDGIRWVWGQPFVRSTSLLLTGSDFVVNGLYLAVIVLAKDRGAAAPLLGLTLAFVGIGGLGGAMAAPWLDRRLSLRGVVLVSQGSIAVLVPLLIVLPGRVTPGLVYGAMFFFHPVWNRTVAAARIRVTPERLQGRVWSIATLLSLGPMPVAALTVGIMLEVAGPTTTVLALTAVMLAVALAAWASSGVKNAPDPLASAACWRDGAGDAPVHASQVGARPEGVVVALDDHPFERR